jgi:hypothetical protein
LIIERQDTREATVPDPIPESTWEKFLTDSEEAILASAPKELSARERAASSADGHEAEAGDVGDLWRRDDAWADPPWRHLDTPERLRRAGRALGAVAALVLLLGLFSCLSEAPPGLSGEPEDTAPQRSSSTATDSPTAVETFLRRTDSPT